MTTEKIASSRPGLIARRSVLALGASAAIMTLMKPASAARFIAPERRVFLVNPHTGEKFNGTYWENGAYVPDAMRDLCVLLRDHGRNKLHEIDPGLIDLLSEVRRRLATSQPIQVISGFRSPESNAEARRHDRRVAPNSLHMQGKAADFRIPGYGVHTLKRAAVSLQGGGVGIYPRADFVHIDTGPVRTW